ncbi:ATP-binding protein [Nonomuraea sp. NPDC049784]|uniref:ATP-binding protein n=1 Tax=Nonomuraea sp. NPDC049784 TaxID=3154361 RepID=UPI0033D1726B
MIHTLATGGWARKGLPLCLIGDSGTGKSHLQIALGTEAAINPGSQARQRAGRSR